MAFKSDVDPSEITPEHIYRNRRAIMRLGIGYGLATGAAAQIACGAPLGAIGGPPGDQPAQSTSAPDGSGQLFAEKDELGDGLTSYDAITNYNNYYEFSTDKEKVAQLSKDFKTSPWMVQVGGHVAKPRTFAVQELLDKYPQEDRVYRLRCVEGWSMVIPWRGFPLHRLLAEVAPTSRAKFVRFETALDRPHMPGVRGISPYTWPYTEGLRLDEAMHDLALLVTGLYGKTLPPQNGAPIRLAVPWKYGFKSAKAIVKIDLVEEMPRTFWNTASPDEYGFYANVNPDVRHPRWPQDSERRIGELRRRPTLFLNGYADQVAKLYAGMDLRTYY
jgi:methionine sulfoxide reductase catalytic subunit